MILGNRTRSLLSIAFTLALLLFHQAGPGIAQADKFQEDMQKGEAALNQRNYEAALNAYKSALRDSRAFTGASSATASATANLGLSKAYLGLGAFKNAIESCDEALKNTGNSATLESMLRNQRGLAIVASVSKPGDRKLEEAVAEFRKVLALTDQDPVVSYNLGTTLLKLNRDAEGVHELQVFVARVGRTPEADAARRMIDDPRRARENFAPDFSVTTSDGEYVTLQDLKGKVVLLDFWGSWCPPCRESTPSLVRYQKKHSSEVFLMVGIAVSEPSADGWRDYIEKNKMVWPQYLDSTRKISNLFKVTGYPTYITIDAEGIIRDRRTGWNSDTMTYIDEQVKRAVKARGTSPPPVLKPKPESPIATATPATTLPAPPAVPTLSPVTITAGTVATPALTPANTSAAGVAVRGRVTLLPGANPNLRVNLTQPSQRGAPPPAPISKSIGPDGLFEFLNVRPGNYTVTVSTPVPVQPIVVGAQDLNGIEFIVPPIRLISGRAVIEGTGAAAAGLRLAFTVIHTNGTVGIGAAVQADGRFSVLMPVGEHRIALNIPGYSIRSMVLGSTDLLREPLRLSSTDTAELIVTLGANAQRGAAPGRGLGGNAPVLGDPLQTGLVTEPVMISSATPQYTQQARDARLEGTVTLRAIIRKDGTADAIEVLQGLGMGLDEQAVAAFKQFRFRPGTRNGDPVDTMISVLVNFRLAR